MANSTVETISAIISAVGLLLIMFIILLCIPWSKIVRRRPRTLSEDERARQQREESALYPERRSSFFDRRIPPNAIDMLPWFKLPSYEEGIRTLPGPHDIPPPATPPPHVGRHPPRDPDKPSPPPYTSRPQLRDDDQQPQPGHSRAVLTQAVPVAQGQPVAETTYSLRSDSTTSSSSTVGRSSLFSRFFRYGTTRSLPASDIHRSSTRQTGQEQSVEAPGDLVITDNTIAEPTTGTSSTPPSTNVASSSSDSQPEPNTSANVTPE